MIIEYAWKEATGKYVGGIIGFLWTFSYLVTTASIFMDVWVRKGLLGFDFGPEAWMPTTLFLNWVSE